MTYRSGSALALVDSKTLQANTGAQTSYRHLVEDVGTGTVKLVKTAMVFPRVMSIVGTHGRLSAVKFAGKDIERVERVTVESGNPFMDTMAGKLQIAELFMNKGLIRQPQEFLTLIQTGRLEPLLLAEQSQLDLIHDENERMMDGDARVVVSPIDWHVGHIKEHQALLNNTSIRNDPERFNLINAHIMAHAQALTDPGAQYLQALLGFGAGPPVPGAPVTDGGGAPPAPGGPGGNPNDMPGVPGAVDVPPPLGQR